MNVIALNGSPNIGGNTYLSIVAFSEEMHVQGFDTEVLHIGDGQIPGCVACRGCAKTGQCVVPDEGFAKLSEKLLDADGVFLAAPVYFGTIPGQAKSFLDRFFFQFLKAGKMRHKVGASAAILRRSGGSAAIDDLSRFFVASDMILAGQCIIHGAMPGEILQDVEGLAHIRRLARNMAWVLKMQDATRADIAPPPFVERQFMNFIR